MIVVLKQNSPPWHAWRSSKKMASESAALLQVSPWYPRNPYDLWQVKSGQTGIRVTPAMAQGIAMEAAARALYEIERSDLMVPHTVEGEDGYAASLDGLSFDESRILEVKTPWKGTTSDLWKRALRGQIPKQYMVQCQHQLMASGALRCDLAVYAVDTHRLAIVEVRPDLDMQARIRAAWDAFWPDYIAGRPPVVPPLRGDPPTCDGGRAG